jgi:drug/metabolite transporter (DMT)-like permease
VRASPAERPPHAVPVTGVLLAAAGAVAYGVATVVGRDLAGGGVDSATALGVRFTIAAALLAALLALRGAPLRPLPGERGRILALGAFGYTLESTLFYLSLERGTAAACVLLFYAYPAIVTAIELARGTDRLTVATATALALSVAGTAVVVGAGSDVSISEAGVLLALGSAAAYAVYLVVGRQLGRRTDAMTAACWVAIGAAAASLARGLLGGTLAVPTGHALALTGYGISTAAAFGLTFAALARIGASHTAVVMTLEACSAVVLAAIFLHEAISPAQALGGAAILAAAGVIAWSHHVGPTAARPARRTARRCRSERRRARRRGRGWPPGTPPGRSETLRCRE